MQHSCLSGCGQWWLSAISRWISSHWVLLSHHVKLSGPVSINGDFQGEHFIHKRRNCGDGGQITSCQIVCIHHSVTFGCEHSVIRKWVRKHFLHIISCIYSSVCCLISQSLSPSWLVWRNYPHIQFCCGERQTCHCWSTIRKDCGFLGQILLLWKKCHFLLYTCLVKVVCWNHFNIQIQTVLGGKSQKKSHEFLREFLNDLTNITHPMTCIWSRSLVCWMF